jgi:hypothetical protein
MMNNSIPQGWYLDPAGQGVSRYWNGVSWTQSVDRGGVVTNVAIDPTLAQIPPGPGTQVTAPITRVPTPAPVTVSTPDHSVMGVIFGVLAAFFLVLMVVAIINNDDSSNDSPTINVSVPATPAETTAPPAPTDTTGG